VEKFRTTFERFLEGVVIMLMAALTILVVVAVLFRKIGGALVWYDEVASILLAWLTYYGAAYAALKRGHIGFGAVVQHFPASVRRVTDVVSEVIVIGFFALAAYAGWRVVQVLSGTTLVSLPWMPMTVTQSVIPIGPVLFIVAELLSMHQRGGAES
jgi:TRAP-type C4-dicarboxylate transport system permease small subunit